MGRSIAHPWLCQFNKARIFTYEGNEYNATRHLLNYIIKLTFDSSRCYKTNIMKLFAAIASFKTTVKVETRTEIGTATRIGIRIHGNKSQDENEDIH